jgi:hypothetical protein
VNVPPEDLVQYVCALGAAVLGHRRLQKLGLAASENRSGAEIGTQP